MKRGPHDPPPFHDPLEDFAATAWQRFRFSQFYRDLPWLLFTAAVSTSLVILAFVQGAFS